MPYVCKFNKLSGAQAVGSHHTENWEGYLFAEYRLADGLDGDGGHERKVWVLEACTVV